MITIIYPKAEKAIAEQLYARACPASNWVECIDRCSVCREMHYRLVEEDDEEEDEP